MRIFGGIILLGIFFLMSCSDQVPNSKFFVNLEDQEFYCYINELPLSGGRIMTRMKISTSDSSFCDNSNLTASAFINTDGIIEIKSHDLSIDQSDCGFSNSRPSRNLNIDVLDSGSYPLSLQLGTNLFYQGSLLVSSDHYELQIPDAPSFLIEPAITQKIPKGAIWYRIYYRDNQESYVTDCIKALDSICTQANLVDGYYSTFTLNNAKATLSVEDKYPHLQHTDQLILLNTNQHNMQSVYDIFNRYKDLAGHQFFVYCANWKADQIELE